MRRRYKTTKREERESDWTLAYDFSRFVRRPLTESHREAQELFLGHCQKKLA